MHASRMAGKSKQSKRSAPSLARKPGLIDVLPSVGRERSTEGRPIDWVDFGKRYSVWILILAVGAFLGYRVIQPRTVAAAVLGKETRVLDLIRAIHSAQGDAIRSPDACARSLGELSRGDRGPALIGGVLDGFDLQSREGVEYLRGEGYLIAMYRVYTPDAMRDVDRTWSTEALDEEAGAAGYGLFAWPEEYSIRSQWAFHVDHRGHLLGGWNHQGLLNGFSDPFPPLVNPLREYQNAVRRGDDGEWFIFDEKNPLDEIVLPNGESEPEES